MKHNYSFYIWQCALQHGTIIDTYENYLRDITLYNLQYLWFKEDLLKTTVQLSA
jgi:hypothetical protein